MSTSLKAIPGGRVGDGSTRESTTRIHTTLVYNPNEEFTPTNTYATRTLAPQAEEEEGACQGVLDGPTVFHGQFRLPGRSLVVLLDVTPWNKPAIDAA